MVQRKARLVDISGEVMETPEPEFKESEFKGGKRPIFIIYEMEGKGNIEVEPCVKSLLDIDAQIRLLESVLNAIKEDVMTVRVVHRVMERFQKMGKQAAEAQRIKDLAIKKG